MQKGDKFGYFIFTGNSRFKGITRYIECLCVCGSIGYRVATHVKKGVSKSCGCKRKEFYKETDIKNGHSITGNDVKHPMYRTWRGLMARCLNVKNKAYKNYGGRGIKICGRWMSFGNFINDVGEKPSPKHTLDRFPDNDGDYEPNNFRWATRKEQNRNKRNNVFINAFGENKSITEWSEDNRCVVKRHILFNRIRREGYNPEESITTDQLKPSLYKKGQLSIICNKRKPEFKKDDIFGCLKLTGVSMTVNRNLYVECICECGNKKYWRISVLNKRENDKCICNRARPLMDKLKNESS